MDLKHEKLDLSTATARKDAKLTILLNGLNCFKNGHSTDP